MVKYDMNITLLDDLLEGELFAKIIARGWRYKRYSERCIIVLIEDEYKSLNTAMEIIEKTLADLRQSFKIAEIHITLQNG